MARKDRGHKEVKRPKQDKAKKESKKPRTHVPPRAPEQPAASDGVSQSTDPTSE